MARTPSNMLALGTEAPFFNLLDTTTETVQSLQQLRGNKGTVISFICNHCPFVLHINEKLIALAHEFQPKGINFIAISSNDVQNYPQDGPEEMNLQAQKLGYPFPYLYDETQAVAKSYDAACTPDFYLFNDVLKLVYRGQMDDSRPGNGLPITGNDLRHAMDCLLNNNSPNHNIQKPSIGCNIKWK